MDSNAVRPWPGGPGDHVKVLDKTWNLMTSKQMEAFKVNTEPQAVRDRYGNTGFGRGCLMARRLVEAGVPFVEVDLGGWDNHNGIFPIAAESEAAGARPGDERAGRRPRPARAAANDTAIIWMGEFGRTPRINGDGGPRSLGAELERGGRRRRLQARASWSAKPTPTARRSTSEPFTSQDLMASVLQGRWAFRWRRCSRSKNGRPMKIANGGKVIKELFA